MKIMGLEFESAADGPPYGYDVQPDEFYREEEGRFMVYAPAGCGEIKCDRPKVTIITLDDDCYEVWELAQKG